MPGTSNQLNHCKSHRVLPSLLGLLLLLSVHLQAKNFYISSSSGSDAYTSVQAQSQSTPWRSITKLNTISATLAGGDSIFFKRGDTFYGTIIINSSGLASRNIVITAYGAGATPVISGFTTPGNWVADANGIYKASGISIAPGSTSAVNIVLMNDVPQQIGRYPNAGTANGGYLKYQSFIDSGGITSITDTSFVSAINWTGAEVVIRKKLWVLDRCRVTSQAGNTIYYSNPDGSAYSGTNNYGYFFQNDERTLDQLGEWYYNKTAAELKMYFGAASPFSYSIKVSTADALVTIRNKKYIQFSNLSFEGSNLYGFYASACDFLTIKNCSFYNMGNTAVYIEGSSDITVDGVTTYNSLNNGLQFSCPSDSNIVIRNCVVKKTGAIRGMGQSNGNSYKGISVDLTTNLLIENNRVDTTGYVAIEFDGSNVLVKNNLVNYFCYNKDDAGGIYTWIPQNPGDLLYNNRVIKNNIVMNGVGAPEGRSSSTLYASGIYLDGTIMNVNVTDNTVFNMGKNGIHCNNPVNITITGNTSFNNLNAVSFMRWPWATIRDLVIRNNIFYPKVQGQQTLYYTNAALNEPVVTTLPDVLHTLGSIDSNYYSSSNPTGFSYEVYGTSGGALMPYSSHSLEGWKSFSGNDIHSSRPFRETPTYFLRNTVGVNTVSNGSFDAGITGVIAFGSGVAASWDNTGKISGGALKVQMNNPTANRYVMVYSPVGAVTTAKKYVLRFKTLGSTAFGIMRVYLRKTASPYTSLTPVQVKVFDTSIQQHEFLLAAPVTETNASYVIEIEQNSGTTFIDDVSFYEADADVYNPDDYLRFEYNASLSQTTVNLGANYVGVDGTYYPGTITLKPFTSKILVKDTSVLRAPLSLQVTVPSIKCYGQTTDVVVTAAGGIPPYRGTGTFAVSAGTYTYTVTDLRGVSVSSTVTVTQPSAPLNLAASSGTITVYGGTTWVNLTATGGIAPYTGVFSFTNVAAGTHTYSVKDANGCMASVTITITQPEPLQAFAAPVPVKCYGDMSTITVTATGGVPPYYGIGVYSMPAGSYRYKVRDASGAVAYINVTLTQPAASLQVSAVAGTITSFGGTTSVSVSASGGTAPYTGTGTINNVAAGSYSYTVTDANGCTATTSVTIQQPAVLLTATNTTVSVPCYDGSVNVPVTASGGVAPYTGTGVYPVNAGRGCLKVSFPTAVSGTYTLLYFGIGAVTPSKNYVLYFTTVGTAAAGTLRAALRQTFSPWSTFTPRQTAGFGLGRTDHSFIFNAPPAEAAASFLIEINQNSGTTYIDNIAFFELNASNQPAGNNLYAFGDFENNISNIYAYSANNNQVLEQDTTRQISRTYYYNITDAVSNSVNAVIKTGQPAQPLTVNISSGTILSPGGTTTVTVTGIGGTAPYTGTGVFTNVGAGEHTYTVTDANGCSAVKTISLLNGARPAPSFVAQVKNDASLRFSVFPNPSASTFELDILEGINNSCSVTVTAADGRLMDRKESSSRRYVFGEKYLPGVYFVTIKSGNSIKCTRIVKGK